MSMHKEIRFEIEICEHLAGHAWTYADKAAVEDDRNLALISAAVTGKIDVRGLTQKEDS